MTNINELFTDNSSNNIESYTLNYDNSYKIKGYKFNVDKNEYFVCNEDGEITFGLITKNNKLITEPTKFGKNQFKILNNVIQCIKLFLDENPEKIYFSGNIKNGLGKLYKTIFSKLQDENYVSFTDSRSKLSTFFYFVRKDKFNPDKYNIDKDSLKNYNNKYSKSSVMEKKMKRNLKESVTITVQNTKNGYDNNVTMQFDNVDELAQLIKNSGIGDYVEINSELPKQTDFGYSGAFDFNDNVEEVPEPYDSLADEIGYSNEKLVIYVDNSAIENIVGYVAEKYNLSPIEIVSYDDYSVLVYSCGDISSLSEFLVSELTNVCPGMIYGNYLTEVAELNGAIPYEYDAEESPYNIKGPAHQMNLRYVPGIMADNPMVDELRESFDEEINKISDFVKRNIRLNDAYRSTGLKTPHEIDTIEEDIIVHKIANFIFGEFVEKECNGEISKTRLQPSNFVEIASQMFQKMKPQLEKKGYSFEIENEEIKEDVSSDIDKQLEKIAKKYLFIDTLETKNSGDDFHEVAVWTLKDALKAAYELGKKS